MDNGQGQHGNRHWLESRQGGSTEGDSTGRRGWTRYTARSRWNEHVALATFRWAEIRGNEDRSRIASALALALALVLACACSPHLRSISRWATTDVPSTNKRLLDEVASVPSKRLRNKISGCESDIGLVHACPLRDGF